MKLIRSTKSSTRCASPKTDGTVEISKVSISFLSFTAASIGCWALAGLVTATMTNGGTVKLFQNFISLLTA